MEDNGERKVRRLSAFGLEYNLKRIIKKAIIQSRTYFIALDGFVVPKVFFVDPLINLSLL